jgi:hypothetical protein
VTKQPSIRERVHQAMTKPDAGQDAPGSEAGGCSAYGCPCRGTVDLGHAGRFFCQWHAWIPSDRWPSVTDGLVAHRWFVDLIGELQRRHTAGDIKAAIAHATQVWRDEPEMQPEPLERANWNLYLWRLREELAHRIGVRKEKPQPRTPNLDPKRCAGWLAGLPAEGVSDAA